MSFLGRIFGRRAPLPGAEANWQIGDWAECHLKGAWYTRPDNTPFAGPRHGQIMRVTGVRICLDRSVPGGSVLTLSFAGWPGDFFEASVFRKLSPRADEATAAEAEFTQLVKRQPASLPEQPKIEEFQ